MTDLENREAFETWYIENHHDGDIFPNNRILDFNGHHNEYRDSLLNMLWESWQASSQRQGFKLAPLEPSEDVIKHMTNTPIEVNLLCDNADIFLSEDEALIAYKAMINAV